MLDSIYWQLTKTKSPLRLLIYSVPILLSVYHFWSANLYSKNFEQTQMRLIDDYAMQFSIYSLQTRILSGNLEGISFKFDYAYGWLFWFSFALVSLPFRYFLNIYDGSKTESLLIVSIRSVNILILLVLTTILFKIIRKIIPTSTGKNEFAAFLLSSSVMLSPAIGYWVGRPMPPMYSVSLLTLGILVGLADYVDKPTRPYWVALVLGLAVGIKINYVIFVPLIALLIMVIRRNLYQGKFKIYLPRNMVKIIFFSVLGFSLGASPALMINPVEALPKYISIFNFFKGLSVSKRTESFDEFWSNFLDGTILSGYGLAFFITLTVLLIFLTFDKFVFSNKYNLSSSALWIGLIILLLQIALSFYLGLGIVFVQSYTLPLIPLMLIFWAIIIKTFFSKSAQVSVAAFFVFLMVLSNFIFTVVDKKPSIPNIDSYQRAHQVDEQTGRFSLQRSMQDEIPLTGEQIDIIQDYTLPTAWSGFRTGVNLTYSYDDWDTNVLSSSTNTLYLFFDKNERALSFLERQGDISHHPMISKSDLEAIRILETLRFGNRRCELKLENQSFFLLKCNA